MGVRRSTFSEFDEFQRSQRALNRRARLDCEPGFERADVGARGGDSASEVFADVECAFWKEEPSLRDALFLFDPESIREVYVVPNFISEGYFTQTVVPRELELNGRITKRSNGQIWRYCEPVGNHPLMTELLLKRARDVAPDVSSRPKRVC